MLREAPLAELRAGRIDRAKTLVVVPMHLYPRGLRRELVDEFRPELGPPKELFRDFRAATESTGDHETAFVASRYEEKFRLDLLGVAALDRLARTAKEQEVVFLCQCSPEERCHRDLLLLLAAAWWRTPVAPARFRYPAFEKRIASGDLRRPPE